MKRYQKAGLIAAGVFAAAGIGLCTAALIKGFGSGELSSELKKVIEGRQVVVEEMAEMTFDGIDSLDIELEFGTLEIVESESGQFRVRKDKSAKMVGLEKNGSTMKIFNMRRGTGERILDGKRDAAIFLEIPPNTKLENTSIEVGAGTVYGEYLDTKNLSLNCGMGDITLNGNVSGNVKIECGVGSISLSLAQEEKAFDYDIECGVGSINAGSMVFEGLGTDQKISHNAGRNMEIDCGVGAVNVVFEEAAAECEEHCHP